VGLGQLGQPVLVAQGDADPEVADRQDVGPVQREDQEHLRRPDADPLDRDQPGDDRVILPGVHLVEGDRPFVDGLGQVQDVAGLDAGQSHAPKAGLSQFEQGGRCVRLTRERAEPPIDRGGGLRRNLLADDRADEGAESVRPRREQAWADPVDPVRPARVEAPEVCHRLDPGILSLACSCHEVCCGDVEAGVSRTLWAEGPLLPS
jgi:hypothetical protein